MKVWPIFFYCALIVGGASVSTRACQAQDRVISTTDLTRSFSTNTPWRFVVTQDPNSDSIGGPGVLRFYFFNGQKKIPCEKICDEGFFNTLDRVSLIYPSKKARRPFLVVETHDENGGPGSNHIYVMIWSYHPITNSFEQIWFGESYINRNEETRLITSGPLAGDLILATDDPTHHFPWRYGIKVYRLSPSGRYVEELSFIGKSAQVGGPPGAVIDADMPELYRRLHITPAADPDYVTLTTLTN
jgi:hypothetical protein